MNEGDGSDLLGLGSCQAGSETWSLAEGGDSGELGPKMGV